MNHADLALRSAALGLASGGRTTAGLGLLAATSRPRRPWLLALAGTAVAGELTADKLSSTPSRLQTQPLVGRSVAGATAAVLVTRRLTAPDVAPPVAPVPETVSPARKAVRILLPAVVGASAAYAGSRLGAAARASRPGWVTAVVEDAASLALAGWAVR